ncbi:MAG: FAD:protein FMN transferase [Desulfarculaceae bacterium]|nr:FAD:protein FMN transferase [Desulfarculaceae bacterium]MCF8073385.1 FAD:protein FMN transferase [Desulfarculaceae bacterium]MCF8103505.1 FAD:protein FMN transferase [Desulfarculaceae bacterium]MCF8115796.1 FAD:protein FMN transferase [Desulfarculaceae bacterium]
MPRKLHRRSFLQMTGAAALGAAALPLVSPAIGLAKVTRELSAAQQTRMMMGTLVSVTVLDASQAKAQEAMEAAFTAMGRLTPVFDRHRPVGPVAAFNAEGRLSDLEPRLKQVMDLCATVQQATDGAFDPSVAPVVDAMAASFAQGHKPNRASLDQALKAVGGVAYDGRSLRLTKENAGLTLDGVAKGYIVDEGLRAAAKAGARHVLINAGGDVGVLGDQGGKPWRVAVADPNAPTKPKMVLSMTRGALATSGDYEVYFDRERLYHHIVRPDTGRSPGSAHSVSVRAPQAALADALATACFVMPPAQATKFLNARPRLEGLILTRFGQRYQTKGFMS